LAGLLETFSQLKKGEHAAMQLVVRPTSESWKEEAVRLVKKLIGAKVETKKNIFDKALDQLMGLMGYLSEMVYSLWGGIEEKNKEDELISKMLYLSPGERDEVEAIENKISKYGFKVKMRLYYLGHRSLYSPARGVSVILSPMKQYTSSNSLKAYKKLFTIAEYFFIKRRLARIRKRLVKLYKERNTLNMSKPMILNSEELATLYHFPTIGVETTMVKTIETKRAEAPVTIPFESEGESGFFRTDASKEESTEEEEKKVEYLPPELQDYNFANKYYEEKFTKDKTKTLYSDKKVSETKAGPPANLPIVE
jgi:hypothetical protein